MYGSTIHTIRKSKNMTLKEAAGNSLSVSQLSRFENGKSVIPVDLFYEVLENLNTTVEEFDYLKGSKEVDRLSDLFDRIEQYNNQGELNQLRALKEEIHADHPAPYSWEQFLIYFIECLLAIYDQRELNAQIPALDYLMQVEIWGEMELRLYALFGFALDVETTYVLMRTALKRSQQYLAVPAAAKLLYSVLSNNFSTFLSHDRIAYAEETIELFDANYAEDAEQMMPHIDFLFNKGLLAFKQNNLSKAHEYCEQAIRFCQLFRQKQSETRYIKRFKNWKENFKNPDFYEIIVNVGFHDKSRM